MNRYIKIDSYVDIGTHSHTKLNEQSRTGICLSTTNYMYLPSIISYQRIESTLQYLSTQRS